MNRLQHNLGHANARNGKLRPLGSDKRNQLFGLYQKQPTDAVDLLSNDHVCRLQVIDHAKWFGAVGAGT